ncbi:MAG: DUF2285 domain-containing protein [Hyphomicrobiales bacterium]|nr:DUF2285 domain-containing protein [Hyphomicrobiales bacterium]
MQEFHQVPPGSDQITTYDRRCFKLYLMLLEADNAGQPWEKAYRIAFGMDPEEDKTRCQAQYNTHLKRARWMSTDGYSQLL